MSNAIFDVPLPRNAPVLAHAPGSSEREELRTTLKSLRNGNFEVPVVVGGRSVLTGNTTDMIEPHDHGHVLGTAHRAGRTEVSAAIEAARAASGDWAAMPFEERASIFLKAADLLEGRWRGRLNASTMLGQSKSVFQADVDAACEMIDFFRFNVAFARQILAMQPQSPPGIWNRCEYRELEGFVLAVTPFNFTSIAGNLPTAPALMGNTVLWKPSSTSLFSNWFMMQLLSAAGLPDGVINFLPGSGAMIGEMTLPHSDLAGIHFTGSTGVFQTMWRTVGENIAGYRSYPRIVGETGGKDFIFVHASANPDEVVTALVRGAFEYQGQKCSAASRAYIPRSLWEEIREQMLVALSSLKMGDPTEFDTFMGAVIDKASFDKCSRYIAGAQTDPSCTIISGGECDDSTGYFVQPTVIESDNPKSASMCEEIFGPILTVHVYEDSQLDDTLALCDATSPYALTGAVFASDRAAVVHMAGQLRHSAGNFYVNDKPTGAVVGQQPFGGSRASGTNDKAGSFLNLLRWTSVRTIKETFDPPTDYTYPHMLED